ncbi:MAG TPA: hypothetical protein VM845_10830 [Burkholderiaceae bacterium]|nr:hypothetical protein [Burkholderiaceae bacterium]
MKRSRVTRLRDHAAEQWPYALVALLLWCATLPLARTQQPPARPAAAPSAEWPAEWRGQALQPLASSAVERRFAAQFPGRIARFALADQSELVLREVSRPTRMLHPAADCWRGIGWQVRATRLVQDEGAALWRCFEAEREGERVRVCERIVDAQGQAFTDTSAWFWAASLGRSQGPWRAITHVEGL